MRKLDQYEHARALGYLDARGGREEQRPDDPALHSAYRLGYADGQGLRDG